MKRALDDAIADFDMAIQLGRRNVEAYVNRGLTRLLQWKDAEAEKDFKQSIKLNPTLRAELQERIEMAKRLQGDNEPLSTRACQSDVNHDQRTSSRTR